MTNFTGTGAPDFYFGDGSNGLIKGLGGDDVLAGGGGEDSIYGGADDDHLYGQDGDDRLYGGDGNDTLSGNSGSDSLYGGAGNDVYYADKYDTLSEAGGGGIDTVMTATSRTLGAGFENLTLTGSLAANGYGNDLDNVLRGNGAKNTLAGKGGDDTYYVQNATDAVVEARGEGHDAIVSSVSYIMPANVEDLTLVGSGYMQGTGTNLANLIVATSELPGSPPGQLSNTLYGEGGDDTLIGANGKDSIVGDSVADPALAIDFPYLVGRDLLTGRGGEDFFVFHSRAESGVTTATRDLITDFQTGVDEIDLFDFEGGYVPFSFLAAKGAAFTGNAGDIRWFQQDNPGGRDDRTIVSIDLDGDLDADFEIGMIGLKALTAGDFLIA